MITADLRPLARRVTTARAYLTGPLPQDDHLEAVANATVAVWLDLFPALSTADALDLAREYVAGGRPALYSEAVGG
jgi:hypothetical protein